MKFAMSQNINVTRNSMNQNIYDLNKIRPLIIALVLLCQKMFNLIAESCTRKHLRLLDTLGVNSSIIGYTMICHAESADLSELHPAEKTRSSLVPRLLCVQEPGNEASPDHDSDEVTKDEYEDDPSPMQMFVFLLFNTGNL